MKHRVIHGHVRHFVGAKNPFNSFPKASQIFKTQPPNPPNPPQPPTPPNPQLPPLPTSQPPTLNSRLEKPLHFLGNVTFTGVFEFLGVLAPRLFPTSEPKFRRTPRPKSPQMAVSYLGHPGTSYLISGCFTEFTPSGGFYVVGRATPSASFQVKVKYGKVSPR